MAHHNELGKIGEQLAVDYLLSKDYQILDRNFFYDKAEIDIIARLGSLLTIIEVKTRNNDFFGDPQESVSRNKMKLLTKAANEYIMSNELDVEVRFDIITIIKNESTLNIEHFEDAFYHF